MKFNFGSFLGKVAAAILPTFLSKGKLSKTDAIEGIGSAAIDQIQTDNPDQK